MTPNTNPKYTKVEEEDRTDAFIVKMIMNLEIDRLVETELEIYHIEVEDILTEIIDQITEVDCKIILGMTTDRTITGKIIDGIIIESKREDIGVQVEAGMVAEIIIEIVQVKDLREIGILVEIEVGTDSHEHNLEERKIEIVIDQDHSPGLDQVQEQVQIEIGLDVISVESMITLQVNVPALSQMKIWIKVTYIS